MLILEDFVLELLLKFLSERDCNSLVVCNASCRQSFFASSSFGQLPALVDCEDVVDQPYSATVFQQFLTDSQDTTDTHRTVVVENPNASHWFFELPSQTIEIEEVD